MDAVEAFVGCSERIGSLTELRSVGLPAELCRRAEEKFAKQFDSVEALLEFVLKDLTRDDAAQADLREQQAIEQRLRDLGYL
jgi:hypothetical protein